MNFLEIQFSLRGKTLPADHGYLLYSAVKGAVVEKLNSSKKDAGSLSADCVVLKHLIEESKSLPSDVLLSSIPGVPNRDRIIYLNRTSRFRLRCPAEQVQSWYRLLQNTVLDIQGHVIRLVQPQVMLPEPSDRLKARLVTFKLVAVDHGDVPLYFTQSCQKALDRLGVKAQFHIDNNIDGDLARRALKIRRKHVVGYGVVVEGLNEQDSLKLQGSGLGGRKHFGCGWFYPSKEEPDAA